MGITVIKAKVISPRDERKVIEEDFMVDSGATYSVLQKEKLEKLGVKPNRKLTFVLADGTKMEREIGDVIFEFEGIRGASPVIFGKKGDSSLFGAVTLETLGLILDPFKRKLRPMKLFLAKMAR